MPDLIPTRWLNAIIGVKGTATVEGWPMEKLSKAVVVKKISGNMIFKLRETQLSFPRSGSRPQTMPQMDIAIEPVVSERQIRWGMVLSVIETKPKEIIQESDVLPYTTAHEIRDGMFASAFAHPTMLSTTERKDRHHRRAFKHPWRVQRRRGRLEAC
ncbi:hypothetical protein M422DRAFT_251595 [Sphaerobolus stellatus SS14]|uniref:Uncharacterized protein n=1 Tax=Sphaerobolus stellatus (strain SS14) TaxID=990650 RepID=A0A0C9VRF8_SPHS4|nr:hypothetical protein M422DRAFT_251595 [Sphaerobolus stellatus SS14]